MERKSLIRRVGRFLVRSPVVVDARFFLRRFCGLQRGTSGTLVVYSIGILTGDDPIHLAPSGEIPNPVIHAGMVTDMDAGFVADPFWIRRDGVWWMFFEVWNNLANKGEIGCARSLDGRTWTYVGRVLRERFHLSYPLVFEHQGAVYMVPESVRVSSVRLYRARSFPHQWVLDRVLVKGDYCDSTVFEHDGLWWMLGSPGHAAQAELHLFWSRDLHGPWQAHPRNPVVKGDRLASRPAGRVLVDGSCPVRYCQVCVPFYGTAVRAYRIVRLSPEEYADEAVGPDPLLGGSGIGWNAEGMHHIDIRRDGEGRWLACVDGWRWGRCCRPGQ